VGGGTGNFTCLWAAAWLSTLRHAHQGRAYATLVQFVAQLGHLHHGVGLDGLVLLLEQRLVLIGVELLVDGIQWLQSVSLENLQQRGARHGEALVQVFQISIAAELQYLRSLVRVVLRMLMQND